MRLPSSPRSMLPLLLAFALVLAAPVRGETIRMVGADERGVTLRLDVGPFDLRPAGGGRSELVGTGLPGLDLPGRPRLPYGYALIALPPGANAVASVVGGDPEEARASGKLVIGDRPAFRDDLDGHGLTPTREPAEPILDGPWPPSPVQVGEPFTVRRQTMVAVQIQPFRYDEATGQLWTRRSITVRLDFTGGAPAGALAPLAEDRHWEPVLKGAVLNYEQGRRWRAAPARPGATGAPGSLFGPPGEPAGALAATAFDESETEVRVKVDSTGATGLEFSKLAAAGFPAGVPIAELSVHRHEFSGYGAPPYATIELPIEIEDTNVKGTFDAGDRILVWVQNWAERSRASFAQREWGDAEVLYVTRLRTRPPLRMGLRAGWLSTPPPVLTTYPWAQHFERDFEYMAFPADTNMDLFQWTSLMDYYSRPDTIRFETNHFDLSHAVDFSVKLQGRRISTHFNWIQVENGLGQFTSVADSVFWSGNIPKVIAATLPAAAFSEGRTNHLVLWGKDLDLPPDPRTNQLCEVALESFDMTYWRSYRALAGLLSCNSGDASGQYEVAAGGFDSDSIRAWEVSDPTTPLRLTDVVMDPPAAGEYTLRLRDATAGPRKAYVIFNRPRTLPPNRYSAVTPHQLYARGSGDYLLVVPEAFLPAANALATLRQSEGLDVVVAPLEAVNDEFNGGRHSSYAIRRFIRYGYDNWNSRFVMLMGDGSEDPLNLGGGANPDWIPAPRVFGPVGVVLSDGYRREAVPSDNWYVWAVDTPPSSSASMVPDLYIGRLPVNSLAQATGVVDKLTAYERVDTTQTWRRRVLLHADDAWSGESTFGGGGGAVSGYCFRPDELRFLGLSGAVRAVIADSAGLALCEPEVFDMNDWLKGQLVDANNCRPDRNATISYTRAYVTPELKRRLNDGRLWWNYQGHANATILEHESIYGKGSVPDDKNDLRNDGKPFLFTAFSCHANAFAQARERIFLVGPSIGEDMVTLPNRGAIATWASTGYEIVPSSGTDHLNVILAKSLFFKPPRDDYLGKGASAVLGEGIAQTLLLNHAARAFNPAERDVAVTYALLGDPATRLSIGPPQIIVTANQVRVTDGVPVFLPGQSDTLLLEADLVSNAAIDSIALEITDATGTTILPASTYTLTPPFPDSGPGGSGGRRFHLAYRTQLVAGKYTYTLRSRDRYGVITKFDVVFVFETVLFGEGQPLRDGDTVARDAVLELHVLSPNLVDPINDMRLEVDGVNQPFTPTPNTPARQFVLTWTHTPFAAGTHTVRLSVTGAPPSITRFKVVPGLRLTELMNFPNPFDDELGTRFTFNLSTDTPADLMLRVYTVSGRMVYERTERGLRPGHHELAWNGLDEEGDKLANGVYLYHMVAKGPSGSASESGRLVKLRKPRHAADTGTP